MADQQTPAFKVYADRYFVTRSTFDIAMKAMTDAVADNIVKAIKPANERIAELEREVGRLKGHAPDREEWPLRAIEGGRRA